MARASVELPENTIFCEIRVQGAYSGTLLCPTTTVLALLVCNCLTAKRVQVVLVGPLQKWH